MPQKEPARLARELASHGYTADREAITLLSAAEDPETALLVAVEAAPDDELKLSAADVRDALEEAPRGRRDPISGDDPPDGADTDDAAAGTGADAEAASGPSSPAGGDPSVSTGTDPGGQGKQGGVVPVETEGWGGRDVDPDLRDLEVGNDMTGRSTGTGDYGDFVATFRDRYERLAGKLKGRVNHRNASALAASPGGGDAGMVGMVADVDSTTNGHWILDLDDTTGVFPCLVMKDRPVASLVDEILHDEVLAVEGTLSDDGSILFVDDLHFPEIPRTYEPSTADRPVQAALISDIHVGSQEFMRGAWQRFTSWQIGRASCRERVCLYV